MTETSASAAQPDESRLPFVSVIIPVYNDGVRLKLCLDALERQDYPTGLYEVVVIDNGSDQPVAPLLEPYPHARSVLELRAGSYAARNAGIAAASGHYLAFTDADCLPVAGWLRTGVRRFLATPRCGLVAGAVEVYSRDPDRPTYVERCEMTEGFPQKHFAEAMHFGATANVFTSKEVFEAVGLFDATLRSGGDREWGVRAYEAGYGVVFEAEAMVRHAARRSLIDLARRRRRLTGGYVMAAARAGRLAVLFQLSLIFRPPVRELARTLFGGTTPVRDRLALAGVIALMHVVTSAEVLRLLAFNGKPAR